MALYREALETYRAISTRREKFKRYLDQIQAAPQTLAIFRTAIFEARMEGELSPSNPSFERLVQVYGNLLGYRIAGDGLAAFISVIQGREENPSLIVQFAVPPLTRVPFDRILQLYRLLTKIAQNA